jgi:hypothetical protein
VSGGADNGGVFNLRAKNSLAYVGLFALGLGFRIFALHFHGVHDQDTFIGWGKRVQDLGLAKAYSGNYFPLEWQLFGVATWLSRELHLNEYAAQKLITLTFDVGAFFMLTWLLRLWRLPVKYAFLYWLSPYFLLVSWLGYVDSQVGFFVLATVTFLARWPGPRGYLLAGVPLGLALLLKPQMIPPVAAIPILVAAFLVLNPGRRRQNAEPLLMLIGPAILIGCYALYFALAGQGLFTVPDSYSPSSLSGTSPGISGTMLNIWYPVALRLTHPGMGISGVTEPHVLNTVGSALVIAIMAAAFAFLARRRRLMGAEVIFLAFLFTVLTVPIAGPHAHENHLFLGLLLSIVLAALTRAALLNWSLIALLTVQCFGIFAVYGLGVSGLSGGVPTYRVPGWLRDGYLGSYLAQDLAVLLTLTCVGLVAAYAVRAVRTWRNAERDAAYDSSSESPAISSAMRSGARPSAS